MRFCVVIGNHPMDVPGGAEYQSYNLLKVLSERGHDCHYIAYDSDEENIQGQDITTHRLKKKRGYPFPKELFKRLKDIDADYYYLRNISDIPLITYLRHSTNGKTIFNISHDEQCKPLTSPWKGLEKDNILIDCYRRIRLIFRRLLLLTPDILVAQTEKQKKLLRKNRGLECTILGNGHPVPKTSPEKDEPPIVLWLASLKSWKNPETFIKLASDCVDLNCRFWLVGRPADSATTELVVERCNELPNIEYKGGCDIFESNEYLGRSTIFVNTSTSEGFPNTFIQAWLRETPVISMHSDPDGSLQAGKTGHYAANYRDLVEKTREYILDKESRKSVAQASKMHAESNYDIELIVNKLENITTIS